jgi:hypothetical protein
MRLPKPSNFGQFAALFDTAITPILLTALV